MVAELHMGKTSTRLGGKKLMNRNKGPRPVEITAATAIFLTYHFTTLVQHPEFPVQL